MKKIVVLLLVGIAGIYAANSIDSSLPVAAGDISNASLAPLNPEYVKYLEKQQAGTLKRFTKDGHALGYIPPPFKYETTISANSFKTVSDSTLPSRYDLRDEGLLTPVKNQGSLGSCWAFATYGSIESTWLVAGLDSFDLSENNLAYGGSGGGFSNYAGNSYLSTAYLIRGAGPISEADDPYEGVGGSYHPGLTPVAIVTDARMLPKDSGVIKQMIYDFGAFATNLHWDSAFLNDDHTYYYTGNEVFDHGVTVVGWDNNKVVAGARHTGAWIIKNSFGKSWGESGYCYVSYEDTKIHTTVAFWPERRDYDPNLRIHVYDTLGISEAFGWPDETDYALVKFSMNEDQQITNLGTYTHPGGTVYLEVYESFNGNVLSGLLAATDSNFCQYAGYYAFDLLETIKVKSGDEIYVKVEYNSPGNQYSIPVECVLSNIPAEISSGIFWASSTGSDGTWEALGQGTDREYDPCVKLYGMVSSTTGFSSTLDLPQAFILSQNYPNPFNPTTTISYTLPEQSTVKLTVFDIQGKEVTTLQNAAKPPGNYQVQWNGMDHLGNQVSTGVYFARLQAGRYSKTIKMLYLQ